MRAVVNYSPCSTNCQEHHNDQGCDVPRVAVPSSIASISCEPVNRTNERKGNEHMDYRARPDKRQTQHEAQKYALQETRRSWLGEFVVSAGYETRKVDIKDSLILDYSNGGADQIVGYFEGRNIEQRRGVIDIRFLFDAYFVLGSTG